MTYRAYAKFGVSWALKLFPGKIGQRFETIHLWSRRELTRSACDEDFERIFNRLDGNSVCIDLGANIGAVTGRLASRAGKVYAFEPDPWAFGQLKENCGAMPNVVLFNSAIGSSNETIVMRRDPDFSPSESHRSQGTSKFVSLLWDDREGSTFEVEQIDICSFIRDVGQRISLIKVDIEGAEADLLERLLDSEEINLVDAIFVETHEAHMPELRARLGDIRRRVAGIRSPHINLDWQ